MSVGYSVASPVVAAWMGNVIFFIGGILLLAVVRKIVLTLDFLDSRFSGISMDHLQYPLLIPPTFKICHCSSKETLNPSWSEPHTALKKNLVNHHRSSMKPYTHSKLSPIHS